MADKTERAQTIIELLTSCILTDYDAQTGSWSKAVFAADTLEAIQREAVALIAEVGKAVALAAELAAAEKRNEELERLVEELGDTQLAGTRNLPADIRTGAGGACGRHGVFHGLVCPKCAASEGKP